MKQSPRWFKNKLQEVGLRQVDVSKLLDLTTSALSVMANSRGASGAMVGFLEAYAILTPAQRKLLFERMGHSNVDEMVGRDVIQEGETQIVLERYRGDLFIIDFSDAPRIKHSFDHFSKQLIIEIPADLVQHTPSKTPLPTERVVIERPESTNLLLVSFVQADEVSVMYDSASKRMFVHSMH